MIGVVTLQRKSVMCLLLLVIAVLMLSGCHQQSRSAAARYWLCSNRQGWSSPLRHSLRRKRAQPNRNRQKIRHFSLLKATGTTIWYSSLPQRTSAIMNFPSPPRAATIGRSSTRRTGWEPAASQRSTAGCISSPRIFQSSDSASQDEADGRYHLRTTTVG